MIRVEEIEFECPDLRLADADERFCSYCNDPDGVIFYQDPYHVHKDEVILTYVCQKCAPAFIAKWKQHAECLQQEMEECLHEYNKQLYGINSYL